MCMSHDTVTFENFLHFEYGFQIFARFDEMLTNARTPPNVIVQTRLVFVQRVRTLLYE